MPKEQKIDKSTNCQCCLIFWYILYINKCLFYLFFWLFRCFLYLC
jgi:hypothetical protein